MVRSNFLFIAGDPALDFVNTEIARNGEPVDLLDSPDALELWLKAAGMHARPISLREAKRLRATIREIAGALAGGKAPRRAAVQLIDEELRRASGSLTLHAHEGAFAIEFEPRDPDARFVIARAAANFLATADPSRVRRCGGTNCVLFFYDATKSATRRWCSMAGCGNRMKAALHYQRTKST